MLPLITPIHSHTEVGLVLASAPAVSLNQTLNGTHMLMLIDLAIPQSSINGTGSEFYPGLVPCRTTRLHWLQTGLTQSANGTFVSDSTAIADYGMYFNMSRLQL